MIESHCRNTITTGAPKLLSGDSHFNVGDRQFQPFNPYVIAEIGVNHEGSMQNAFAMIELAAEAGAHAVKFQSYTAQKLAAPLYSPSYWDLNEEPTNSQFELFKKYDSFSIEDFSKLADVAKSCGVDFLSTPFDPEIASLLAPIVPAIKIASADLTNVPLITHVAGLELPMIVSTGGASDGEIGLVAQSLAEHNHSVAFLHCVLNYPTSLNNANLLRIANLRKTIPNNHVVGYSDHVPPAQGGHMSALEASFWMGATVIEKHFTDDRRRKGNDHYHAADFHALKSFVSWTRAASEWLGTETPNLEIQALARENARRRIFTAQNVEAGETLTTQNLIPLRANQGINIDHWPTVLGKRAKRNLKSGQPLTASDF